MDKSQCDTFQSAQKSAVKVIEKGLAKLGALAGKLESGAKLSRSDRSLLGRVEKNLGKGNASASGVRSLIGRGEKIAGALKDQTTRVAENQNQSSRADARAGVVAPSAAGERTFSNTVFLMPRFYDRDVSTGERGRQIAHEADHLENNGVDKAYQQDAGFSSLSPADAANNPDSVVGALGFPDP